VAKHLEGQVITKRLAEILALGGYSLLVIALLDTPASGFWLGAKQAERKVAEAQWKPFQVFQTQEPPITRENRPKHRTIKSAERPTVEQSRINKGVQAPSPKPSLKDPTPLERALASCEAEQTKETFVLPGSKGDVRLDNCYRGRDHLNCTFNALTTEAKDLVGGYSNVIEASYTDVSNVSDVCGVKQARLESDIKKAAEFSSRFDLFKTRYNEGISCARTIVQSLNNVTLRNIPQGPDLLKSMIETLQGEVNDVSVAEAEVAELAKKMDTTAKAMTALNLVHHSMCLEGEGVLASQKDGGVPASQKQDGMPTSQKDGGVRDSQKQEGMPASQKDEARPRPDSPKHEPVEGLSYEMSGQVSTLGPK
jgi:hypothetical protein